MSISAYRRDLRINVRGYWSGAFTRDEFFDNMFESIDIGLSKAWQEGAKDAGILPDEISPTEQGILASLVFKEYAHVPSLDQFVRLNSREEGGKLRSAYARVELWVNRYKDVRNRSKVEGEKDPKLQWKLGPTEKSCNTCLRLNNKIKRASWWKANVMPQQPPNPALECKGWKCGCDLLATDEPMSRGRMPNVP